MSSSSPLAKQSHLLRRVAVSALVAAALACGVFVGEGSALAYGGVGRGGVPHVHVGGFGRPIVPYRAWGPAYGYAPGYAGWRAPPGYYWGARPGWGWGGRGYVGGRGYYGGGHGYVGGGRGGYGGGGHAGGGHGGHGR